MKPHPHDPRRLADAMRERELEELSTAEVLADIRANPEIYFSDHLDACRRDGVLPLSELAWRRACLAA